MTLASLVDEAELYIERCKYLKSKGTYDIDYVNMDTVDENIVYNRASMKSAFNPFKQGDSSLYDSVPSKNDRDIKFNLPQNRPTTCINVSPFNTTTYNSQSLNSSN